MSQLDTSLRVIDSEDIPRLDADIVQLALARRRVTSSAKQPVGNAYPERCSVQKDFRDSRLRDDEQRNSD